MKEARVFHVESLEQQQRFLQFVSAQTPPYQAELGPIREQRTMSQNSRLWALHALASKATGHTAEEMHEFALCRHFGSQDVKVGGIIRQIPNKRSSARERKEFSEFMETTESWYASEFGIWLGQDERAA